MSTRCRVTVPVGMDGAPSFGSAGGMVRQAAGPVHMGTTNDGGWNRQGGSEM